MQRRDAIVVGGGPAGSTVARALVGAGLSVAVLDKRSFPRDKTCAGWITPAVVKSLALDLEDYARARVLQPIRRFRIARFGDRPVENDHGAAPVSYGIRRFEFDDYLLRRSGAELATGVAVERIERRGADWVVNGELAAPLLVGAGGHFCPVARHLGAQVGRAEPAVGAQEFEVEMTPDEAAASPVRGDTPQLYFAPDLAGYAWIFRKGDWLNVGIGRVGADKVSEHFDRFVERMRKEGMLPERLAESKRKGHAYLLYTDATRPLVADGALLVGDAAGLAYPESGEGIRTAVESALLAARVLRACGGDYSAAKLAPYARAIEARYGPRRRVPAAGPALAGPAKRALAALLLRTHWFTREIVTRRWFLHEHVPPLSA
ncbi:MAG: NAD(P)/FAD-dependent oxidoreductase [Burkholderiales bacterium]|nr:NAD(P)/FAD-dependent oxidoreductase [Burkholderiales bacterium]